MEEWSNINPQARSGHITEEISPEMFVRTEFKEEPIEAAETILKNRPEIEYTLVKKEEVFEDEVEVSLPLRSDATEIDDVKMEYDDNEASGGSSANGTSESTSPSCSKRVSCYHCKYKVNTILELKKHMLTHLGEKTTVSDVPTTYESDANTTTTYEAPICDIPSAYDESTLYLPTFIPPEPVENSTQVKVQNDDKVFNCTLCPYVTNQKTILNLHMRTHTGEKPHKCPVCNYSAAQRSNLTKHMRRHTGEKPHKCTECSYSATEKSDLNNHMRVHTGEKPHKCTMCGYCTIQKSALISHMRRHTGEKPHKCEICDYRTVQKSTLMCHMRIHTGEKPHSCTLCDYKATGKSALNIHMRIHTGEKPHVCGICNYRTNQISNLSRHLRMHVAKSTKAAA